MKRTAKVGFGLGIVALVLSLLPPVLMALGKMITPAGQEHLNNSLKDLAFNSAFAIGGANMVFFSPIVLILAIVTLVAVARAKGTERGTGHALWGLGLTLGADVVSWATVASWLRM